MSLVVRLLRRGRTIHPFGVDVDSCTLGMGTFGGYRARILGELDAKIIEENAPLGGGPSALDADIEGPALVWSDDVWLSRRALRTFLSAVQNETAPARFCLPKSRLLELFLPLQDVDTDVDGRAAFEVAWLPAGKKTTPRELFSLGRDRWREPLYRDISIDVPVPRYILKAERPSMIWPLTSTVALRVRHWVHVLRAGHLAPQVALLERAAAEPVRSALRALLGWRPSEVARNRAWRAAFSYRGARSFVHPTATVEGSVLGDDVVIGAYSYITNSVIGDGSVVEQRAHVSGSALGPRTFVSLNSSMSACVTFGDTDACVNGMQACVIAPKCALTSFARPLDLAVEGPVRVEDDGKLREVGELPCGVAFGPGVFAGADVVIAAGRAIPAGVRLYVDGKGVLQRLPHDLAPGSYAIVDGKPLL